MDVHVLETAAPGARRRAAGAADANPGRGLRAYTAEAAAACRLTDAFRGLDGGVSKSAVLGALKRACVYMGVPLNVVSLVDLLFKYTRDVDWRGGQVPIVWPSNEELARAMSLTVRQLQNLLKQAQGLGLLSFRDSPNGKRGGCRNADGAIIWAYGIVLAPIGTRYAEFEERARIGASEDARLKLLRKRLEAGRRRIRTLAQAAIDAGYARQEGLEAMEVALLATRQMRQVRDPGLYAACIESVEQRGQQLAALLDARFEAMQGKESAENIARWHEADCTHSTSTNELPTAKADTCSSLAEKRSGGGDVVLPAAKVEEDMTAHGVGLGFISELAYELCPTLPFGDDACSWGEVVSAAERLSHQAGISGHAFHEAVRTMGQRGAAASVIVTLQKYRRGDVHRPGAYLRGMSRKAAEGSLKLGPTLHGLRDVTRSAAMKSLSETATPSVGSLLPGLLRQAGYRR